MIAPKVHRPSEAPPLPNSANLAFVERLYSDFLRDPEAVPEEWRRYFEQLGNGAPAEERARAAGPAFRPASIFNPPAAPGLSALDPAGVARLQDKVNQLVRNYRVRGHMIAQIDPLGLPRPAPSELDLEFFGFTEVDLDRVVSCETIQREGEMTVREILQVLRETYCRSIGVQYMHIDDLAVRRWLQRRMEGTLNRIQLSRQEQLRILTRLTDAVTFEEFIRKKFIGAKSFSLEGCESLVPLLDLALERASDHGIREVVLGMAHRGRLNVLANVMGKSPRDIFREFEDSDPERWIGRGDVKYHLGYSSDWTTQSGKKVHVSLCFNPSHLEYVNPVALGRVRAKQDRIDDVERASCMALLIHGDAAFAGEGLVQETLNLSRLKAYAVGGTLHVVVNNQIGFTTAPGQGRSSLYATGIARMLQVPIFHVNGEDPEAVAQVVQLAMDFRMTFKLDVVIDIYGYRRLGHNEGDEPSFTQPVLYRAIARRKPVRAGYLDHLLQLGEVTREEADEIAERRRAHLEKELSEARRGDYRHPPEGPRGIWARSSFVGGPDGDVEDIDTGVARKRLATLLRKQTELPPDFRPHPKIERFLEARRRMARGEQLVDWSAAEALAFASVATGGWRVRMTGQDSERGTFSQRHSVLHDHQSGQAHTPLQHLAADQAPVEIFNSPLSEAGVLGFDYGYSLDCPDGLVLWEAQFGDFVNTAQVIIDQFIASAEDKWRRLSGIVLLLPHGFEGQGPEHSSARLERFLTLAAEDNMQIVYPTTPAQYFHCLRRQVVRRWRKPLIVMTPKSLLRHPKVVSGLDEMAKGRFQRVIPETSKLRGNAVKRVLLCSGKVYWELQAERERLKRQDVAIVRLEQLYPLPPALLESALQPYGKGTPVLWVQEEPENMGAWSHMRVLFGNDLFGRFPFSGIYRAASASPATGSSSSHKQEQKEILARAFGRKTKSG